MAMISVATEAMRVKFVVGYRFYFLYVFVNYTVSQKNVPSVVYYNFVKT